MKDNVAQKEKGFKGLLAWQKAYSLTLDIYKVTKKFPRTEVYGLGSQLQRAAVSIPANIAEGYERSHRKEHVQFFLYFKRLLGRSRDTSPDSQGSWILIRK